MRDMTPSLLHLCSQSNPCRSSPWRTCSTSNSLTCVIWRIRHKDSRHDYIAHRHQFLADILSGECVLRVTHVYVWHDSFTTRMHTMTTLLIAINFMPIFSNECVLLVSHSYVWHDSRAMTHSYVRHDSFICVTWLIHMYEMTRVPWLIHICDMTHSYLRHDSFVRVTWLIHMCDVTQSYVWHDSRAMTHSPLQCATWLHCSSQSNPCRVSPWGMCSSAHSFICVTWLIHHYNV